MALILFLYLHKQNAYTMTTQSRQLKPGVCARIIALYRKGRSKKYIIGRGYHPTTVNCQIWRVEKGLA